MKIALAQMEVKPAQPEKNLETMLEMIEQAKKQKVDVVAFPEMCLGGYLIGDKFLDDDFCADLMEYNEDLAKASVGITIIYGNIYVDKNINTRWEDNAIHPNKDGRTRKYNAAYIYHNGKPVERANNNNILPQGVQPKTLLPNYRFFDDERYFFSAKDIATDAGVDLNALMQPFLIKVGDKRIPISINLCEDMWCEDYRLNRKSQNIAQYHIQNGAQAIINISASPWTYGKHHARDRRVQFLAKNCSPFVPYFYINCVGAQNNGKNIITFDGGSTIYNNDGLPVKTITESYTQDLLVIDLEEVNGAPITTRTEKKKIAQKYDAMIRGLRHLPDMIGTDTYPLVVNGMSGGVDSDVSSALLVDAFGIGHVLGLNLPTEYNSEQTKQSAAYTASKLGIKILTVPISTIVNANQETLQEYVFNKLGIKLHSNAKDVTDQNIQAKIRGTNILSNVAGAYHALFINNGNKLETALGYATLYGDVGGAIAVLGDLTKTEVFEMARYINNEVHHDEIIPWTLIPDELFRFDNGKIAPSAELKEKQIDPMRFGYHDALLEALTNYNKTSPEQILRWYKEGTLAENLDISNELLERWDITTPSTFIADLDWFRNQHNGNVFKRVQAPPIIILSKSAYGYDIRESIIPTQETRAYTRMKAEILQMDRYYPKAELIITA